jgi:hypothetical protein
MQSRRATLVTAIALAAVFAGTLWTARGPAPEPAATAGNEFSAERAFAALRSVLNGNSPHPIGGGTHDAVRDRIVSHLERLGYVTQIQRTFACDAYNTCGTVANIIARRPNDPARPGVLLAAHYDSVPAGPGASDDGLGVATILEIARVIRQEPFRNPPLLLIDDGEEAGLLGAEGFAADPDLLRSVGCVINVEARGTNGPSMLFETSRNNRWLVGQAVSRLPRPVTSSLFATIYDLLPNDTDLTVFKRSGVQGVNFGIIGNVAAYHTPLDNLEHVSLRSLQHHGINALAILRNLGNAELRKSDQNAVWFDVFSLFVVRWPERASIWIAIGSAIALLIATMLLSREGRVRIYDIGAGALAFVLSAAGAALAAFAVAWLGRLRAEGAAWVAHPRALVSAMWIIGLLAPLIIFGVFRRRVSAEGLQLGSAVAWHAVAIALAAILPGASYLFIAPSIVLSAWALVRAFGAHFDADVVIATTVAAVILFPFALSLYDGLGAPSLTIIAVLIAFVATTFAAFVVPIPSRIAATAFIAVVACIGISLSLAPYDSENPRRLNVLHVTDDGGKVRWAVNAPTAELGRAAPFRPDAALFPWLRRSTYQTAPAPSVGTPPVEVSIERDDRGAKRTVAWRILSQRAAPRVALLFRTDATIESIRINGRTPPPATRGSLPYAPGWNRAVVRGSEASVEVTMRVSRPIDFVALDYTYGVPPVAPPLIAARNASHGVPSDDGDVTITMRRGRI